MPLAPEERIDVPLSKALDGGRHLALEGQSAHLSVGDDCEAGLLLEANRLVDGAVFGPLQLSRVDLSTLVPLLGLEQLGRPQETADDVGAGREHGRNANTPAGTVIATRAARRRRLMRDILVLCPQERDITAIRSANLGDRYRVHFEGSDLDQLDDFDPVPFLASLDGIAADGVIGTKDQSALLASLVARERGLPSPTPEALIACQHKLRSR